MTHYKNTADYISRALLGRPDGFPVWMKAEDCRYVCWLLEQAAQNGDSRAVDLHKRFDSQWGVKVSECLSAHAEQGRAQHTANGS